ncbi:MAG: XdhC family protein, partial [Bacteroidota bacterium]
MFNEFLKKTQELYHKREPFAIAFVVNRQVPSSGKPGDKAVIQKSGEITGWIGGGCTRGIVIKEANNAINEGKPRLVRISPEVDVKEKEGVKDYKMVCHSGGTMELYIEPILPQPEILILGKSKVATALCRLAKAMDYNVNIVSKGADKALFPNADRIIEDVTKLTEVLSPNSCIVVCTQGEDDEGHLEQALRSGVEYVSFVASRRKANAIFRTLRKRGTTFDDLKRVKTPAGLDINAKLSPEVALSILAQIVAFIRAEKQEEAVTDQQEQASANANIFINPVCGVPVEKSTAKHVIQHEDKDYYFCCDGCKVSFEKEPERY